MRNFIGRQRYLDRLHMLWKRKQSGLIALYGRRRVGKTELIRVFSKDKVVWYFEAIEGADTATQVKHVLRQLSHILKEPYLADLNYDDWPLVFDLLTQRMKREKKLVLVFDELPWMASGRTQLVSYLKYYWDKEWKRHPHLLCILCGSVAAWMVRNVVRSNAL